MTTETQNDATAQGAEATQEIPATTNTSAEEQQETVVLAPAPFEPMIPFSQFKRDVLNVKDIAFMRGKGRMFANVGGISIIVGQKTDITKPLFVRSLLSNKDGEVIERGTAYVLINSENVSVVATL